ncbi:MAG: hypothetical protein Kow0080_05530 [Candidatus Promineifilaceae bacterium]
MLKQVEAIELDEPFVDVLTEGGLHKVMVAFDWLGRLPVWFLAFVWLAVAAVVAVAWQVLGYNGRFSLWAGGLVALFTAVDAAILISLPRLQISFGRWQGQWLPLAVPRVAAALAVGGIGLWLKPETAVLLHALIQFTALAAYIKGAVIEPTRLTMSEVVIFSDRLPIGTPPIKVLHISDIHVERLAKREAKLLELVAQAEADVIAITGDYVNLSYNRDPETLRQVRHLLSQLSAPYGVYATLGSPPVDLRETVVPVFNGLPVYLMRRDWTKLDLGNGRNLTIVGMDCTHYLPQDRAQLAQLAAQVPDDAPQLFLYHSPELMPEVAAHGIDLYLCGHTHGGQVRLPLIGPLLTSSQLGRRYVMGLYRAGRTHLYVSRGVGLEGLSAPRVRFLAPPEITLFTIRGK